MQTKSRKEKNTVIKSILKIVQGNGGRFLEYKRNVGFIELTPKKAHMKVGHALRDMALASRKTFPDPAVPTTTTKLAVSADMDSSGSTTSVSSMPINNSIGDSEQPLDPLDSLDLLESIPADEFIRNDEPPLPELSEDTEIDMLQWLVGESNGLLQAEPIEPVIEPTPLKITERNPVRASVIMDTGLLQWLVSESNDLLNVERFEMV
jgi:hypothetical protein